jgi:hypothetical protein
MDAMTAAVTTRAAASADGVVESAAATDADFTASATAAAAGVSAASASAAASTPPRVTSPIEPPLPATLAIVGTTSSSWLAINEGNVAQLRERAGVAIAATTNSHEPGNLANEPGNPSNEPYHVANQPHSTANEPAKTQHVPFRATVFGATTVTSNTAAATASLAGLLRTLYAEEDTAAALAAGVVRGRVPPAKRDGHASWMAVDLHRRKLVVLREEDLPSGCPPSLLRELTVNSNMLTALGTPELLVQMPNLQKLKAGSKPLFVCILGGPLSGVLPEAHPFSFFPG